MFPGEFGCRIHGRTYGVRLGTYVVLRDDDGRIASVRTISGLYLPGGGIDPGESPKQAAVREVYEETGYAVEALQPVGQADELVVDHEVGFLIKRGVFFVARSSTPEPTGAGEDDHELLWLLPEEAQRLLRHESHAWAVRQSGVAGCLEPRE